MNGWDGVHAAGGFIAAGVVGTLIEYGVHRLMHARVFLYRKHAKHHQAGTGQGWLGEFGDYFLPSLPIAWVGFLVSLPCGIGFAAGAVAYAAAAAYAHQVQHENPDLVFWLRRPVHHLHHSHKMWRHNFGILTDIWDRVFGTYKPADWAPSRPRTRYPLSAYFRIKWF